MTGNAPVEAVLDAVSVPILILRSEAQIAFSNAAGRTLLTRSGAWLVRDRDTLSRIGTLGADEIKALIHTAKSSGHGVAVAAAAEKQIVLRATPVAESTPIARAWPASAVLLTIETTHERDHREWLRHLARRFRLTPMEQIVLQRIGAGATVDEIAAELGVLPTTIRSHLAALFDKTGRRRQSGLIRLALGR